VRLNIGFMFLIVLGTYNRVNATEIILVDKIVLSNSSSSSFCPDTPEGEVCQMDYQSAFKYCSSINLSVPFARLFANYSVKHSQGDVRDTQFPGISLDDPRVKAEENRNWGSPIELFYHKMRVRDSR
jgi:hypothetical protein